MSSAEDIGIWDNAVQAYSNGLLKESIETFFTMATVSAKISFNIGSAYLMLNEIDNAIKHFKAAVKKDNHLAIGYYMTGISYYRIANYAAALEQFERTIECMRGNNTVDYKQLGLKYQLCQCEVLTNQAVIHSKLNATDVARDLLQKAVQLKTEKRHEVIKDSLSLMQRGCPLEPILPPNDVMFKPSAHAVKNLEKKDYLGKAKVLYSADPEDNKSGFSGLKLLEESRQNLLSDIKKPGRKETLKRVAAPSEKPLSDLALVKPFGKGPPRKPLPQPRDGDERERAETWSGKPTKPLPKGPTPLVPTRSSNSPHMERDCNAGKWTGMPSENSAFKEKFRASSPNCKIEKSSPTPARPPKKPLPKPFTVFTEKRSGGKSMDLEVQFSFSIKIKANENSTVEEILEKVSQQTMPRDMSVFYTDGLGRQKKLTQSAFDHILQGSLDDPKLVCSPK